MSFGMGSGDSVPVRSSSSRSNKEKKKKSRSRGSSGGSAATRYGRELYGDRSSSSSSSSSSFRTKSQMRDSEKRNANFLENEMRKQNMLMKEQDSSLEVLSSNLTRLGDISHAVSIELDEQAVMLDDLDREVVKGELF